MSLTNYTDLQTGIQNWLQRQDLNSVIPDFITLFEAVANRRLRVRQMEATTILNPNKVVTITNAAAGGGSGTLIVLTLTSSAGLTSTDQVTIAGVVGTTEANGIQTIFVDGNGTTVELLGTTFVNAYVSGGTLTDVGNVPLPADYLAWRQVTWLGNPVRNLDYVHPAIMATRFPQIPIDLPSEFTIEGGTLRVMPQDPTALKFLYYQKIPALATNTTNWLMTTHPDLYLFGSLAEAQGYTVDPEKLALWKARRDELFDEVQKLSARTSAPSNVRPIGPTP